MGRLSFCKVAVPFALFILNCSRIGRAAVGTLTLPGRTSRLDQPNSDNDSDPLNIIPCTMPARDRDAVECCE